MLLSGQGNRAFKGTVEKVRCSYNISLLTVQPLVEKNRVLAKRRLGSKRILYKKKKVSRIQIDSKLLFVVSIVRDSYTLHHRLVQ